MLLGRFTDELLRNTTEKYNIDEIRVKKIAFLRFLTAIRRRIVYLQFNPLT